MIPIETAWFVFLYLMIFLIIIFGVWIGFEASRRRTGRRLRIASLTCRQCGMIFLPNSLQSVIVCPRCNARNENRHQNAKNQKNAEL